MSAYKAKPAMTPERVKERRKIRREEKFDRIWKNAKEKAETKFNAQRIYAEWMHGQKHWDSMLDYMIKEVGLMEVTCCHGLHQKHIEAKPKRSWLESILG